MCASNLVLHNCGLFHKLCVFVCVISSFEAGD